MCPLSRRFCCFVVAFVAVLILIVVAFVVYSRTESSADNDVPSGSTSRAVPSLKLIAVFTRHGNRAPYDAYPNDRYPPNNTDYWPYGAQQLTNVGRGQMYRLGRRLRALYDGFLKTAFSSADLYAVSTPVNRTLQSGLCLLAGLYPPRGQQVWDQTMPWQPIPLFSDSPDQTPLIMQSKTCPRFHQDFTTAYANMSARYSASISALGEIFSKNIPYNRSVTARDVELVWDAFVCEENEGYPLPDWSKDVFPQPMADLVTAAFKTYIDTVAMVRLQIGTLYDMLLDTLHSKMNGTLSPDRSVYYFSGHDVSLLNLQKVLGVSSEDRVGVVYPASALVLELHQDLTSGVYGVQVLYMDGQTEAAPRALTIDGCGLWCPLSELVLLSQRFTGVDYVTECQLG